MPEDDAGTEDLKPGDEGYQEPDDNDDENDDPPQGGDLKAALQQERGKRKALRKELSSLKADVEKMKPLAEEYTNLLPYLPQILAQKKENDQAGTRATATVEEAARVAELSEFAQIGGYLYEDGSPNLDQAARVLAFMDKRTDGRVTSTTAGTRASAAASRAQQIKEKAYEAKDKDGNLYATRKYIDQVFDGMDPEQLVQGDNAVSALVMARGLGGHGGKWSGATPGGGEEVDADGAPLHVETSGGRPASRSGDKTPLTAFEKQVARSKGLTDKQYMQLRDQTGQPFDGDTVEM
jgi:hypothetical protein